MIRLNKSIRKSMCATLLNHNLPRYNQKTHWYELKPLWNRTWLLSWPGFVKLFSIRIFSRWTSDYTWKLGAGSRLCLSTLGNFALFILFSPSLSRHFHPNCEIWCVYYTASTDAVLYGRRQVVSLYIFNWVELPPKVCHTTWNQFELTYGLNFLFYSLHLWNYVL